VFGRKQLAYKAFFFDRNMEEGCSNLLTSAGFNACNAKLQATALTATRKAVGLPSDVGFHRSMDHGFAQDLDAFSERVLLVTNKLLNLVATVDQSQGSRGKGKEKLASEDDVVDNFHSLVVDSMDQLLEKTASSSVKFIFLFDLMKTFRIYVSTTFWEKIKLPQLPLTPQQQQRYVTISTFLFISYRSHRIQLMRSKVTLNPSSNMPFICLNLNYPSRKKLTTRICHGTQHLLTSITLRFPWDMPSMIQMMILMRASCM
jgi:PMC2NT (NUC016) domain